MAAADTGLGEFDCPICFDAMEDPRCLDCGHLLCYNCLKKEESLKERTICPLCNDVHRRRCIDTPKVHAIASHVGRLKDIALGPDIELGSGDRPLPQDSRLETTEQFKYVSNQLIEIERKNQNNMNEMKNLIAQTNHKIDSMQKLNQRLTKHEQVMKSQFGETKKLIKTHSEMNVAGYIDMVIPNATSKKDMDIVESRSVTMFGESFHIEAEFSRNNDSTSKNQNPQRMGLYLYLDNPESSCGISLNFILVVQNIIDPDKKSKTDPCKTTLSVDSKSWGNNCVLSWSELCNKNQGWLDADGALHVCCYFVKAT